MRFVVALIITGLAYATVIALAEDPPPAPWLISMWPR